MGLDIAFSAGVSYMCKLHPEFDDSFDRLKLHSCRCRAQFPKYATSANYRRNLLLYHCLVK